MKKCYVPKAFNAQAKTVISQANQIIEEYQAKGFVLTLRQLYYQFVSRDLIPNKQSEYKRLGAILNDARLAGEVDWEAMEDRTRNLVKQSTWRDPAEIVSACADQFRTNWWQGQPFYVETWVEKDALLGVVERACEPWQVPYFSCRGYTSASELYQAARRIGHMIRRGKRVLVLHLGDHDPSGCDMTRDIRERLELFLEGDGRDYGSLKVQRIALNMDQVREYDPPPNPAKLTDSRANGYIEQHGDESWELDALPPEVIAGLVRDSIEPIIDIDTWDEQLGAQSRGRKQLSMVSDSWNEVISHLPGSREEQ